MNASSETRFRSCLLTFFKLTIIIVLVFIYFRAELTSIFKLITEFQNGDLDSLVVRLGGVVLQFASKIAPIFIAAITLLGLLALISRVTIPVSGPQGWWNAVKFMLGHLLGRPGMFIRVRDGKIINPGNSHHATGPGLVWVDQNSAVLVSDHRVLGYGIWTLNRDERISGAVDLRRQSKITKDVISNTRDGIKMRTDIHTIFSISEEPDTFFVTQASSDPLDIQLIDLQSRESAAGVDEFIAALVDVFPDKDKETIHNFIANHRYIERSNLKPAIHFGITTKSFSRRLKQKQRNVSLPLSFDHIRITRGIQAQIKVSSEEQYSEWVDYPSFIAVDVLRDLLIHESCTGLYLSEDGESNRLDQLMRLFCLKLICCGLVRVQYVASRDSKALKAGQSWNENNLIFYPILTLDQNNLLRELGIKITNATFSHPEPVREEVKEQLFRNWRSRWIKEELETIANNTLIAMRIRNQARIQAQRDMIYAITQVIKGSPHSREALAFRIYQALETAATDPATRSLLSKESISLLDKFRQWLLQDIEKDKQRHDEEIEKQWQLLQQLKEHNGST